MENMEIAWEDFILEEPRTSKAFVQPRTSISNSRPGSRKHSVDSKTSKASGDSNVIFSKVVGETTESLGNLGNGENIDPAHNKDNKSEEQNLSTAEVKSDAEVKSELSLGVK